MKSSDIILAVFILSCAFSSATSEENTTTTTENTIDDNSYLNSYYKTFEKHHRSNLSAQNIKCVIKILKEEDILVRFSQETLNNDDALIANLNVFLESIQQQKMCGGGNLTEDEEKILGTRLMGYIERWKNETKGYPHVKFGPTYTEKVDYCLFNKMRLEKSDSVKAIERKLFSGGADDEKKIYEEQLKTYLTAILGTCYGWYDIICYGKFSPTKTIVDYIGTCVNYLKPPYFLNEDRFFKNIRKYLNKNYDDEDVVNCFETHLRQKNVYRNFDVRSSNNESALADALAVHVPTLKNMCFSNVEPSVKKDATEQWRKFLNWLNKYWNKAGEKIFNIYSSIMGEEGDENVKTYTPPPFRYD